MPPTFLRILHNLHSQANKNCNLHPFLRIIPTSTDYDQYKFVSYNLKNSHRRHIWKF
jgi:hypothetical protein